MNNNDEILKLLPCSRTDTDSLVALTHKVKWDFDEKRINRLLRVGSIVGHRTSHGELISSTAVFRYGQTLTSLGLVIVHPDFQGRGLGKKVLEACIQMIPEEEAIVLIATPEGKPVYEKLGFTTVDSVHKYMCESVQHHEVKVSNRYHIEDVNRHQSNVLHRIIQLDADAFGAERKLLIQNMFESDSECLVLFDQNGEIEGLCFATKSEPYTVIGPLVAPNDETAFALLTKLTFSIEGRVRIDIPDGKTDLMKMIESIGFHKMDNPPVMICRTDQLPKRNGTYYALASQALG
ncbi:GNAT family N-acetyltransferase [Brevibacillus daliensis]|uniref:GNAT family N-acetyltransferase n=1 Tax=Brevibacillus daliensis TaxID=2892995 RepID=UPI001E5A2D30|nr:GNAT family N-acetyltransferase [Brevibacillus daliensis]